MNIRVEQTNLRLDQTRQEISTCFDQVKHALLDLAEQQRFMVREFRTFSAPSGAWERS
jgi:hypothetical protein